MAADQLSPLSIESLAVAVKLLRGQISTAASWPDNALYQIKWPSRRIGQEGTFERLSCKEFLSHKSHFPSCRKIINLQLIEICSTG